MTVTTPRFLLATLLAAATTQAHASEVLETCKAPRYEARSLGSQTVLPTAPLLRFVQLSDVHIFDDDAFGPITGTPLELALEPTIANGSAQRLQDEYTDEVLNAMLKTVNACHEREPFELLVATGDNTDHATLNEVRRFIDNLDGVSGTGVVTAYEENCGYLTVDPNEKARLFGNAPCLPELRDAFAVATGKLAADSQAREPDPDAPEDQFAAVRSPRQVADTATASAAEGSLVLAPGLPPALRCDAGEGDCDNVGVEVPYYVAFGNHDGYPRGTVTFQAPMQAGTLAFGRYFFESQREWINEFFRTESLPGPVGHGFAHAGSRLDDDDDRNDGWYAFDAAGGAVRMIVLNTMSEGVRNELHRDGQTGADTGGVVRGNEVSNPIGLEMGEVSPAQFTWLEGELDAAEAAGQAILVFSHHPDRSFTEQRLGFPANGGHPAADVLALLGNTANVVAWIAGHTHENVVRPCAPGDCALGSENVAVENGFWRVETASLIDYPQEGRIVELFDVGDDWALRLTMIRPDPSDDTANLSRDLAIAEATCNVSQMLGGSLSSGPYDQGRLETVVTNGSEAAVQQKFCFGEASLTLAEGTPGDRNVILLP